MQIIVIAYAANWGNILPEAKSRWDAALAFRGIRLTYEKRGFAAAEHVPARAANALATRIMSRARLANPGAQRPIRRTCSPSIA
jgi:hypothetical protein